MLYKVLLLVQDLIGFCFRIYFIILCILLVKKNILDFVFLQSLEDLNNVIHYINQEQGKQKGSFGVCKTQFVLLIFSFNT